MRAASMRTSASSGDHGERVRHQVGDGPLQQRRVGEHERQFLADVDGHPAGRHRQRRQARPRPPPPSPSGTSVALVAPACSRLMSSRLPITRSRRSADVSMASSRLSRSSAREADVGRHQPGHRRLDRGQRGAQVVRHRLQQRRAQRVGLGERTHRLGVAAQLAGLQSQRHLIGEGAQHASGRRCSSRRPCSTSWMVPPRRAGSRCRRRARAADRCPTRCSRSSRRWCGPARRPTSRRNSVRNWSTRSGSGSADPMIEPVERASAVASARARSASRDSRAARSTSRLTRERDGDEHAERDDVVGLGDGERVHRRCEEPVRQQRRDDRRDHAGPDAADGGDHHDEREVAAADALLRLRCGCSTTRNQVSSGRPTRHSAQASSSRRRGTALMPADPVGQQRPSAGRARVRSR